MIKCLFKKYFLKSLNKPSHTHKIPYFTKILKIVFCFFISLKKGVSRADLTLLIGNLKFIHSLTHSAMLEYIP